tara:strand:+ start:1398 stop:2399 length:1002 start_codon:yes stop_codon:yes gene_type:complete
MDYLSTIWGGILGFAVIMYVLLDGFDLGIGILFPFVRDKHDRAIMMSTIIHVWDGNQTWLVLGGACMFGAFPTAFAAIMPVIYFPILIMLIALILRGVSFEFRLKSTQSLHVWDTCFFLGSFFATFSQGVVLGTFVQGFGTQTPSYLHIPHYQWLTTFSFMTGVGTVCGYVLLGACWLVIKTQGHIQDTAYRYAWRSLALVLFFMIAFSVWTPFLSDFHFQRWLSLENIPYLAILPLITGLFFFGCGYGLYEKLETVPFLMAIGIFLCGAIGVTISVYPYIVPHSMTLAQAAAPPGSLRFMLFGVVIMMPFLLLYTLHSYFVFRGKVTKPVHY